MKGFTLLLITVALSLPVALSPAAAEAHYYSQSSALNDGRWSILHHCGSGPWWCWARYEPNVRRCGSHSWCWTNGWRSHREKWLGVVSRFCRIDGGRAEHGRTVTHGNEHCWGN